MPSAKASAPRDSRPAVNPVLENADALLRAAVESSRQHERVGRLIEKGCADDELQSVAELCDACNRHLGIRTTAYETVAAAGKGKTDDAVWHSANTLWQASREYSRRHQSCDAISSKLSRKGQETFGELHVEYELEASALLALRQAIAAYRRLRPEAE
jgi:hypothetical protein